MSIKPLYVAFCVFFIVIVQGKRNDPYCKLEPSSYYPLPVLNCYNYRGFPAVSKISGRTSRLSFDFKNNSIEVLQNGMLKKSGFVNIDYLVLCDCEIETVEKGAFQGGIKITEIDLMENSITDLNLQVFEEVPNLERLHLDQNPLSGFPSRMNFPNLIDLNTLSITNCGLQSIRPNMFKNLENLQKLYLSDNPIREFPEDAAFPSLPLTHLGLDGCQLHSIGPNLLKNLIKLRELVINDNDLTTLDWRIFHPLKKLKTVVVVGVIDNPWHCDCKIKFLLDYLDSKKVVWLGEHGAPECATAVDTRLVGVKFDKINKQLLVCPSEIVSVEVNTCLTESLDGNPQKGKTGERVILECAYSGYPEPIPSWTKNSAHFNYSRKRDFDGIAGEFDFTFKQTIQVYLTENITRFTCSVTNVAGLVSKEIVVETPKCTNFVTEPSETRGLSLIEIKVIAITAIVLVMARF